jgi:predicted phosphodiesterase
MRSHIACPAAIGSLTLACMLTAAVPRSAARDETRFIVLGDSQLSHMGVFERMIHEAELLRPDFVIQVGDLIHGYTHNEETLRREWQVFRRQIAPLTAPYYPVPGNHDVVTPEAEKVYGEVWGADRFHYSFDHGSVHGIVLNSWWGEEDDRVADWQREWLADDLRKHARDSGAGETIVAVFVHSPLWRYASDHPGRADWEEVHKILREYPVRLVVAGHTHEYVWEQRDGIDYVVINSSGGMRPNERGGFLHAYLHVSVLPGDDMRCALLRAGSVLPVDTVDSHDRSRIPALALRDGTIRLPGWEVGQPVDRTIEVPLMNRLDTPRLYRLDWRVPHGIDAAVDPAGRWMEVEPGGSRSVPFRLTSSAAPEPADLPWLEISTEEVVRTGVVSRGWEAHYRRQAGQAPGSDHALAGSIPMEAPVRFAGRYDLFVPPVAVAERRAGTIVLDGVFDEADWQEAPVIDTFTLGDGAPPANATRVKFLYDDHHLYVAARMDEPDPSGLVAKAGPPIPFTWSDDDFELFFDPGKTQRDYVRLFQNAAGTRFNSLPRRVDNRYFDSAYESRLRVGDDHWSIEMRIPWSDIAVDQPPRPGDTWALNIGRHRPRSALPETRWSGPLYEPDRYGILRFAE